MWIINNNRSQSHLGEIMSSETNVSGGIGLGTVIAAILSYSVNKSIMWMIIHGIFGGFYIVYHVIKYYLLGA